MSRFRLLLVASLVISLGLFCAKFAVAGCPKDCNTLVIKVFSEDWVLYDVGNDCQHGTGHIVDPKNACLSATGYYGPQCRVILRNKTGDKAIIDCQQNYCAYASGDITVTQVAGPPLDITTTKGAYARSEPGYVYIH